MDLRETAHLQDDTANFANRTAQYAPLQPEFDLESNAILKDDSESHPWYKVNWRRRV